MTPYPPGARASHAPFKSGRDTRAPFKGVGAIFGTQARIVAFCYLALLPVLALFAYVRVIPIGFSALLSFYKWNLISPRKPFVGLANYAQLLSDENFQLALKNTTIYSFSAVVLSAVVTLPLALFLARRSRWSAFYQTVYFLPVITP